MKLVKELLIVALSAGVLTGLGVFIICEDFTRIPMWFVISLGMAGVVLLIDQYRKS